MAKGPLITEEVIKLIAKAYLEHPEWRAKEIQSEVNTWLRKQNPRLNPDWPGLSAIQKELTKIRKIAAEVKAKEDPIDGDWSIGSLVTYGLPTEAIPLLLGVKDYRERTKRGPLSIRRAHWIARLYTVVNTTKVIPITRVLDNWAALYMTLESICRITDTPLDTSRWDHIFSNNAEGRVAYYFLWAIIRDKQSDDDAVSLTNCLIDIRSKSSNELTKKEEELVQFAKQLEHDANILSRKNTFQEIVDLNVDNILNKIESLANELTELRKMDEQKGGTGNERTHNQEG